MTEQALARVKVLDLTHYIARPYCTRILAGFGADVIEFSGDQRQRIAVARALVPNPSLVILDEPVSALDVSIRAQIMNLLHDIQQNIGVTYLLIAHDLAVVKHMSNRIGVMYLGKLVEIAESEELHSHPLSS